MIKTVTYKDNGYIYFYDRAIKLWTIYAHDDNDYQINTANHYNDKVQLIKAYPLLKFTKWQN